MDRIERRPGTCCSHPITPRRGLSLLLMRKLGINGAGFIWLRVKRITDRSYSGTYSSAAKLHKTLPGIFLQHDIS
jgi:hypothetical protein